MCLGDCVVLLLVVLLLPSRACQHDRVVVGEKAVALEVVRVASARPLVPSTTDQKSRGRMG